MLYIWRKRLRFVCGWPQTYTRTHARTHTIELMSFFLWCVHCYGSSLYGNAHAECSHRTGTSGQPCALCTLQHANEDRGKNRIEKINYGVLSSFWPLCLVRALAPPQMTCCDKVTETQTHVYFCIPRKILQIFERGSGFRPVMLWSSICLLIRPHFHSCLFFSFSTFCMPLLVLWIWAKPLVVSLRAYPFCEFTTGAKANTKFIHE